METNENKETLRYLAPHITIVRGECETIMAGSGVTVGGDGFGWGAREDSGFDWDDDVDDMAGGSIWDD